MLNWDCGRGRIKFGRGFYGDEKTNQFSEGLSVKFKIVSTKSCAGIESVERANRHNILFNKKEKRWERCAAAGEIFYRGPLSDEGRPDGYGTICGTKEPVFKFGRFQGVEHVVLYEGSFLNGQFHGIGKESRGHQKPVYEGDYKNGRRHGEGKGYDWPGTLRYEGDYRNGRRHGTGWFYGDFLSGFSYHGEFKNGLFDGYGKEYDDESLVYQGYFREGRYHGEGTLYYSCFPADFKLIEYQGKFFKNRYIANNRLCFLDGRKYEGKLKGYIRHGKGKITNTNGSTIQGFWNMDKPVGKMKFYNSKGDCRKKGQWIVGKLKVTWEKSTSPKSKKKSKSAE